MKLGLIKKNSIAQQPLDCISKLNNHHFRGFLHHLSSTISTDELVTWHLIYTKTRVIENHRSCYQFATKNDGHWTERVVLKVE